MMYKIIYSGTLDSAIDNDIVNIVFGKLIEDQNFKEVNKCAILFARNVEENKINKKVTKLLDKTIEFLTLKLIAIKIVIKVN